MTNVELAEHVKLHLQDDRAGIARHFEPLRSVDAAEVLNALPRPKRQLCSNYCRSGKPRTSPMSLHFAAAAPSSSKSIPIGPCSFWPLCRPMSGPACSVR